MIGIFDSGVGGLTILKDIHKVLPKYSTMYLGDSARAPYGEKNHEQLVKFAWQGIEYLFNQGCPLVVVACNTASAQALRTIQQTKLSKYPGCRVLGVIKPTIEVLAGKHKNIGILATTATVNSHAYIRELTHLDASIGVVQRACPAWGPLVEKGFANTDATHRIVNDDVRSFLEKNKNIEAILLACTHYPILYDYIRSIMPTRIYLYEQGPLVAASLKDYFIRHPEIEERIEKKDKRIYCTTGDIELAKCAARQIADFDPDFIHVDINALPR